MDKWIGDNPKSAAYMLYLLAVVVLLSVIALYYFRKAHESKSALLKIKTAQSKTKVAPLPAQAADTNDNEVKEKDGFTIIDGDE